MYISMVCVFDSCCFCEEPVDFTRSPGRQFVFDSRCFLWSQIRIAQTGLQPTLFIWRKRFCSSVLRLHWKGFNYFLSVCPSSIKIRAYPPRAWPPRASMLVHRFPPSRETGLSTACWIHPKQFNNFLTVCPSSIKIRAYPPRAWPTSAYMLVQWFPPTGETGFIYLWVLWSVSAGCKGD